MRYTNLTQDTYNRISERHDRGEKQTSLDIGDLLEAYESACTMLDIAMERGFARVENDIGEFLYTEQGNPRVEFAPEGDEG